MKRFGTGMLAAVFAVAMAQAALACDKEAKGGCSKSQAATTAAVTPDSSVVDQGFEQVMAKLPKMTYRVGSLETPCSKTAREASAKNGEPVQYVVAGETYGCRETAMNKLAEEIQKDLPTVAKVAHVVDGEALSCPKTAAKLAAERNSAVKHMVAGVTFDCPQHAQQVADRLAAKLASSHGCAKAFATATGVGCGSSGQAEAKTASTGGCSKSVGADVATASTGGCSKAHGAGAATASTGGCSKSQGTEAKTAATTEGKGGCCSKTKGSAETAAQTGGCNKTEGAEAKTAAAGEAKGGCCPKGKAASAAAAQTASAEPKDENAKTTPAADTATADAAAEETPQLANAKLLVREIVEFVAASRNS